MYHCPIITFLSLLLFLSHLPSLFLSPTDHHAAQLSLSSSRFLFICGRRSGGLSEVISRVSVEVEGLRGATAPCCVSWLSAPVLTTANKTRQRSGNLCQHGLNQLTVARSTCYQRGPQKCCEEARCEEVAQLSEVMTNFLIQLCCCQTTIMGQCLPIRLQVSSVSGFAVECVLLPSLLTQSPSYNFTNNNNNNNTF